VDVNVIPIESQQVKLPAVNLHEWRQNIAAHPLDLRPDPVVHDGY
jgi:hypothetical protein